LPSFFFSSRRRHTRFSRDWSSDVCSSDLFTGDYFVRDTRNLAVGVVPPVFRASERRSVGEIRNKGVELALDWSDNITEDFSYNRSEERRVGKERAYRCKTDE